MSWQQEQSIPLYVLMWSHAPHGITRHTYIQHTLYIKGKWEIFTIPALILVCWLSDRDALKEVLLFTLQASSTKRWQGYERLAQVHICIAILIIWFSSGCYCVPFYKSGYKIQTFIPAVPWARFSHFRIVIDPLEPLACVFYSRSFLVIWKYREVWEAGFTELHIYHLLCILIYLFLCLSQLFLLFFTIGTKRVSPVF